MRRAGLVGGIAPGSTIDYYRLLVSTWQQRLGPRAYPPLLIDSIDLTRMLALVANGDREALAEYLAIEVDRLARAGAAFAAFASNTPHIAIDEVRRRVSIPMLSIVEATRTALIAAGIRKVGLLGTRFTMEGGFYQRTLADAAIEVVVPDEGRRVLVHQRYVDELIPGVFSPTTRDELLEVVAALATAGAEAVILGGTELPLLLRGTAPAIPFVDTTALHVEAIVTAMLEPEAMASA